MIGIILLTLSTPAADAQTSTVAQDDFLAARAVWVGSSDLDRQRSSLDAPADPWFGRDKALHFGASFLITLSGQYVLESRMNLPADRAWPVAATTALSLGLFKEIADSQRARNPHFSWRDMAWNTAGVALALGVILI